MMKEPDHRPMSFRANSFSRFAKKHGISAEVQPIDPYGLVDPSTLKESRFFVVTISKDGRLYTLSADFNEYRTSLPSIEDILEYMANESAIYERFGNDARRLARLIRRPLPEATQMLRDVHTTIVPFKSFMGPEAYFEFLQITEDRG